MNLLAVIPARAGSKGVPGKALRLVGGVPMILRTLRAVKESSVAERIVVSTNDPEVASFCRLRGYEVLDRPDELAADDVPVIQVVKHVVQISKWEGRVGIFQPTCPLLRSETVSRVVCEARDYAWVITASPDPRVHWFNDELISDRQQRQQLEHVFSESGAIQLIDGLDLQSGYIEDSSGECISITSARPMTGLRVIEISPREALDVDTEEDLVFAERLARTAHIHFVVAAGPRVGTGHYWRSRTLAERLAHHRVTWEWRGKPPQYAQEVVEQRGWRPPQEGDPPDVVVYDRLTPDKTELLESLLMSARVVVIEDEGRQSACYADLLINDMLEPDDLRYAVLRPEFLCLPPRHQRECADRVLVTFGGTDPARLTDRVAHIAKDVPSEVHVLRPGDRARMAEEMRWADVVITGQGRTVYEAAACGTPCISIAANEREARHLRIPGVTYLGHHAGVIDEQICCAVQTLCDDRKLREENANAAARMIDGRGADRLAHRIEDLLL